MKILILLPRVPYPIEKGDKLRAYNHIRFLSKNNEIHLIALNDQHLHADAFSALKPFCHSITFIPISKIGIVYNLIKVLFTGKPFQVGYFYNKSAQKKINQKIQTIKPDHIFCQLIRVSEYIKNINIPKTLDYQDVFSKNVERRIASSNWIMKILLYLEYKRLLRYEHHVFDFFDNKIIISKPDRNLIPHPENEKIHVIPNGVDYQYFTPIAKEKKYHLVFTGNMGYPPNIDSVEFLVTKILPIVHQSNPKVNLLIAGANPHRRVQALKSENVTVSGWVPDMRLSYASACIFIAPMRLGTGLQNKLLEAMSMQLPCITSQLANEALGAKPDNEILIGNSPEEYAHHILHLLEDKFFANYLAINGHKFIRRNYDWEKATLLLDKIMISSPK